MLEIANIVKHPCYEYEKEYRVIFLRGDKEFTINGSYNSKEDAFYMRVPLEKVKTIIVGPCADYKAIKLIFANYFPQASFVQSQIPYRTK